MLFILISAQINLDIIFLVVEVASSPVRVMITLIIDASIPCLVEIQALGSIFGAASWTWREVVMLAYLSEALVASCLHRSVGASSDIPACSHHLLSPHFELVLHEPVVVRVLQVGMPISKSAVAGQLRRKLGIHGLREVRRIFALRTIITLEEVVQAWWPSDCLLLDNVPLSLQLLVLYIVSCLLSHIH